jgi:hypothetical protein
MARFAPTHRFAVLHKVENWIKAKTRPATSLPVLETARDLLRSKGKLVAENALLGQQLIVLQRSVKQPKLTRQDRWLMVVLSSKLPHWKQVTHEQKQGTSQVRRKHKGPEPERQPGQHSSDAEHQQWR